MVPLQYLDRTAKRPSMMQLCTTSWGLALKLARFCLCLGIEKAAFFPSHQVGFTTPSGLRCGSRETLTRCQCSQCFIQVKPVGEAYSPSAEAEAQGKLPEAATSLREAIRLQPDFAGAHTTLAATLKQLAMPKERPAKVGLGHRSAKTKRIFAATFGTNSGIRLLKVGDPEGAISQFRAAILWRQATQAHFNWQRLCGRKATEEEASQEFNRAAELDPQLKP